MNHLQRDETEKQERIRDWFMEQYEAKKLTKQSELASLIFLNKDYGFLMAFNHWLKKD